MITLMRFSDIWDKETVCVCAGVCVSHLQECVCVSPAGVCVCLTCRCVCVCLTCRSVCVCGLVTWLQHGLLHHTDAVAVHHLLQHVEDLLSTGTLEGKDPCQAQANTVSIHRKLILVSSHFCILMFTFWSKLVQDHKELGRYGAVCMHADKIHILNV